MRPRAGRDRPVGRIPAGHLCRGREARARRRRRSDGVRRLGDGRGVVRHRDRGDLAGLREHRASSFRSTTRSSAIRSTIRQRRRRSRSFLDAARAGREARLLRADRAGRRLRRRQPEDARGPRRGPLRISGQKVFITCGTRPTSAFSSPRRIRRRRRRAFRPSSWTRDHAGLRPVPAPGQARRQRLGDRRDLPDGRARAGRRPARRGGRRFQDRDGDPRRRADRHRRTGGRDRDRSLRGRRPVCPGAPGLRKGHRRIPGDPLLPRRHGDRVDAARLLTRRPRRRRTREEERRTVLDGGRRSRSSSRPRWRSA